MNSNSKSHPKKKRLSGKEIKASLKNYKTAAALLASEPYLGELLGLIMRGCFGGVSIETELTPENLAWAKTMLQRREQLENPAYACIATKEVPQNRKFPDGPKRLTGKVLKLINAKPKNEEQQRSIIQKLDTQLAPLYKAFQVLGMDFLAEEGIWFTVSEWVNLAKMGNKQSKHAMSRIFSRILLAGNDGRPQIQTEEGKHEKALERKRRSDARKKDAEIPLRQKIFTARATIPHHDMAQRKKVEKAILSQALASPDKAVKAAAKKLQTQINNERL